MPNNFFTATGTPSQGSGITSPNVRAEFALIEQGFNKLPTLTGNGSKLVRINSGATGMEPAVAGTDYATPAQITASEGNALAFAIALG